MTNGTAAPQLQVPKHVYGLFAGPIDQQAVQRIANALILAVNNGVETIHLLFQTNGGVVPDGVCLYNLFKSIPLDIALYNVGSIASIGVIAYLGADHRKSCTNATFMIHKTYFSPIGATANRLLAAADAAFIDDQRIEGILHSHITLPQEKWDIHKLADLWLTANEALTAGLATEIANFDPPSGTQLFYLGAP
jgi:ATP-dependent protease ClpP protease subunit